jgi:hypothetical protein
MVDSVLPAAKTGKCWRAHVGVEATKAHFANPIKKPRSDRWAMFAFRNFGYPNIHFCLAAR